MALIRGHHDFDEQFTQIPNAWLRDQRLSLATRGLLAQIMSHKPGWSITLENLAAANGVGRDAIRSCINQLIKFGYLTRSEERERNSAGQVAGYTYKTQTPQAVQPTLENPTQVQPTLDKQPHKKNNLLEEQLEEEQLKNSSAIESEALFEEFWLAYPRKEDKKPAQRVFDRLSQADKLQAIAGAKRYRDDPNLGETKFQKLAKTWLNAEAWNNPPLPERPKSKEEKIADRERENAERLARLLAEEQANEKK